MKIFGCSKFEKKIDEYFSGSLGEKEAQEMLAHIETCAGCKQVFRLTEEAILSVKRMPLVEPPKGFDDRVLSLVFAQEGSRLPAEKGRVIGLSRKGKRIWAFAFSYVIAFGLVITSAFYLYFRTRGTVGKGIASLGSDFLDGLVARASELSRTLEYVGSVLRSLEALEKLTGNLPGLVPSYMILLFLVPVPIGLIAFLREILVVHERRK
ncbi:MAG: zf-HC2 domain-containing protein [Candidatus Eisenbacteria bacterium]|nr:zf-HC2 domain-containing protein [Candidatus Eisenbacteria bacterium]